MRSGGEHIVPMDEEEVMNWLERTEHPGVLEEYFPDDKSYQPNSTAERLAQENNITDRPGYFFARYTCMCMDTLLN